MNAPTCGEISCDECNDRYAALAAERDQLRAELADQAARFHDEIVSRQGTVRANQELDLKELNQLRDQLAAARQRETVAIASWDEERGRALREGARVVEWRDRAERAEAEVKRLGHLEAVLRSCAFDKDGTAWKTVCGWWSKKYDAVERQMSENATRAELAEAELAAERARTKQIATALTDAISTYFGADKLVTAERIEAWQAALKEGTK